MTNSPITISRALTDLGSLTYYYCPAVPETPKTRKEFGFGEHDRVYLCPQNLFKIHPDMDKIFSAILQRDVRAKVVLIAGKVQRWTDLLRRRWAACIPEVMERIVFLPRLAATDFICLIALADVMLDTVHFNGMNTSLEAFSVGTPVVTWPGEFQRGRHTRAMYLKMGITECIGSDFQSYVDIAVRVATDAPTRARLSSQILESTTVLFEDSAVIKEFERAFVAMTLSAGLSAELP